MYGQTLNLYGVVGRKAASVAGFEYSEDLRKSGATLGRGGNA